MRVWFANRVTCISFYFDLISRYCSWFIKVFSIKSLIDSSAPFSGFTFWQYMFVCFCTFVPFSWGLFLVVQPNFIQVSSYWRNTIKNALIALLAVHYDSNISNLLYLFFLPPMPEHPKTDISVLNLCFERTLNSSSFVRQAYL